MGGGNGHTRPQAVGAIFRKSFIDKGRVAVLTCPIEAAADGIQECVLLSQKNLICCVPPPKPPPASPKEPLLTLLLPPWEGLILSPTHPKMLAGGALINGQY